MFAPLDSSLSLAPRAALCGLAALGFLCSAATVALASDGGEPRPAEPVPTVQPPSAGGSCDASIGPAFTITERSRTALSGEVHDCAGIASLALVPGAANVELSIDGGQPGDARWTFTVRRLDGRRPVVGGLVAAGAVVTNAEFDLPSRMASAPTLAGLPALVVLVLALAVLGRVAMRSR
jgi:hypothetical protein